jgi:hypothetical protein
MDDKNKARDEHMSDKPNRAEKLSVLQQTIVGAYGEELWTAIKTGIAVIGSLSFRGIANPISLLYEGGSGRGKSTIINVLNPDRADTKKFVYRLDNFTPKSFVSHAANVPKGDIEKIDILPQLRDKTLLVKELAPIFRGREDELRANFSVLTSVLDGKGHVSASGVHGRRGYEGSYVFNWLGATTPIPAKTDAIMAQLGNRILRYEIVGTEPSEEDLMKFAEKFEPEAQEERCQDVANEFLTAHFVWCPPRSIDPESIAMDSHLLLEIVRLAKLIAHGRIEVNRIPPAFGFSSTEEEFIPSKAEGPFRIILYLRTIAQALALVEGRNEVSTEDVEIIRLIAFSTINFTRREVLREVLFAGGILTSNMLENRLGVSRPTARSRMREFAATGIVTWSQSDGNRGDSITLANEWKWLRSSDEAVEQVSATEDDSLEDTEFMPAKAEIKVPLCMVVRPFRVNR